MRRRRSRIGPSARPSARLGGRAVLDGQACARGTALARPVGGDPRRVFVVSDAHGLPELITNALRHAGSRLGTDVLV